MRQAGTAIVAAAVAGLSLAAARAGEDVSSEAKAPDEAISAAMVRFITQHHPSGSRERPRFSFDAAEILPQKEPGKYAVFGGYMAFGGAQPSPHAYGLTMRQTCPRHDDPECWQLEKLLIDQALVVDK